MRAYYTKGLGSNLSKVKVKFVSYNLYLCDCLQNRIGPLPYRFSWTIVGGNLISAMKPSFYIEIIATFRGNLG